MENLLNDNLPWIILSAVNFLLILLLFFMNLANKSKIKKLRAKYNTFMKGLSDRNLEEVIDAYIEEVRGLSAKNKDIEVHLNNIERNLLYTIQKIGIVRFNAFDNVGSDLSFSIALLDYNDNGIVLSGIYARDSSSTYAKPVASGKSKYQLSAEEIQAIDLARKNHRGILYVEGH